ncbi:hypothetical protein SH528x_003286 [Novipirellula sp. SH528]|uniref:hypothetical protein n=1 Tax=Novipirellula sp. SH528 TaxID=3454466 RepID=UPI003F9FA901
MPHDLITYYSDDVDNYGMPGQYYRYAIFVGPGPKSGVSVATIMPVSRSTEPQNVQTTFVGKGDNGAYESAEQYLDGLEIHDGLKKIKSNQPDE